MSFVESRDRIVERRTSLLFVTFSPETKFSTNQNASEDIFEGLSLIVDFRQFFVNFKISKGNKWWTAVTDELLSWEPVWDKLAEMCTQPCTVCQALAGFKLITWRGDAEPEFGKHPNWGSCTHHRKLSDRCSICIWKTSVSTICFFDWKSENFKLVYRGVKLQHHTGVLSKLNYYSEKSNQ